MEQLSSGQVNDFIKTGFVKVENAFPEELADECRAILWEATKCAPDNPKSWTMPVIRLGEFGQEPFRKAANTPILLNAFDQLAGKNNWLAKETLGSFPIRFPSKQRAVDTGWHVDASFPGIDPENYLEWRINIYSKGRALLMLFLFSDVAVQDGPTIIRVGSHFDVAKILEPEGEGGLSFLELAQKLDTLPDRDQAFATGKAGTVYLCHPFIVHSGQDIRGSRPRFMAQPTLLSTHDFDITGTKENQSPVEIAIVEGLKGKVFPTLNP